MKKSLMLFFAAFVIAAMTGCGGGSSAKSKSTSTTVGGEEKSEAAFEVAPEESATNVTYKTSASGSFPPAPPQADLQAAQDEANSKL